MMPPFFMYHDTGRINANKSKCRCSKNADNSCKTLQMQTNSRNSWKTQILTESEFAAFWKLSALPSGK